MHLFENLEIENFVVTMSAKIPLPMPCAISQAKNEFYRCVDH
jgi:hypothetical protein